MTTSLPNLLESTDFRRMLVLSLAAHAVAGLVAVFGAFPSYTPDLPPPVFVELVADPAPPAAAKPRSRQPLQQPVVIPKEPKAKPKPKPKPKAKAPPKPEPKPKAEPQPSAAELLARLREQVEEREAQEAAKKTASAAATAATNGGRGRFDPLMAIYRKRVIALLHTNFAGARAFVSAPELRARYEVRIDASGSVQRVRLLASSGNRYFDESAERAVHKTKPFPSPPRGDLTLDVTFAPGSVF